MRKRIVSVLMLCTTACASPKYKNNFLEKDHTRSSIELTVHLYRNKSALNKALKKRYRNAPTVEGMALWDNQTDKCELYVFEPTKSFDLNTWGHELAHCVYGSWHPQVSF